MIQGQTKAPKNRTGLQGPRADTLRSVAGGRSLPGVPWLVFVRAMMSLQTRPSFFPFYFVTENAYCRIARLSCKHTSVAFSELWNLRDSQDPQEAGETTHRLTEHAPGLLEPEESDARLVYLVLLSSWVPEIVKLHAMEAAQWWPLGDLRGTSKGTSREAWWSVCAAKEQIPEAHQHHWQPFEPKTCRYKLEAYIYWQIHVDIKSLHHLTPIR